MPRKHIEGTCHICGKQGKLSFEHVPPAGAFNKVPAKTYKAIDLIQSKGLPWETDGLEAKILQRGSGGYTLCVSCNSFTGAKYAKDFIKACDQAMNSGRLEVMDDNTKAQIGLLQINPVKFAKQILTMFASVNSAGFFKAQPQLRNLVLDENATGIDMEKYAIFMYLYRGGVSRQAGISASMTGNGMILSTELTTVPFGFVMVLDPNREQLPQLGAEITDMLSAYPPDTIGDFLFKVPVFVQYNPLPLDFRTKEDILQQVQKNAEDNEVITSDE